MRGSSKASKWLDSRQPADRTCCYCRCQLTRRTAEVPAPSDASIDHYIPKCRAGVKHDHNCVLSCTSCNHAKSDMTGEEFVHFLKTGEVLPSYVNWTAEKTRRLRRPAMVLRGGFWVEK